MILFEQDHNTDFTSEYFSLFNNDYFNRTVLEMYALLAVQKGNVLHFAKCLF